MRLLFEMRAEECATTGVCYVRPSVRAVIVTAADAIRTNRECDHGPKNQNMIEREARVLELLVSEGYLD